MSFGMIFKTPVTMVNVTRIDTGIQMPQFVAQPSITSAVATKAEEFWQDERGSINLQNWKWSAVLERLHNLLSRRVHSFLTHDHSATKGEYNITTSNSELTRLRLQTYLYDGGHFVLKFIKPGDTVLEIGSGTGDHAVEMARLAGSFGIVIGMDIDPEKTHFAKELATSKDVRNITFETGDTYKLKYPDSSFNIVYLRFLLQHMADPSAILKEVWRALKPGGKIVIIESVDKAPFFTPIATTFENVRRKFSEVVEKIGADLAIGSKMTQLLSATGFSEISSEYFRIDIRNSDDHVLFKQYLDTCLPLVDRNGSFAKALEQNVTRAEMDQAQYELVALGQNPHARYQKLIIGVMAIKPYQTIDKLEKIKNLVIKACTDGGDPWLYEGHIAIVADIAFRLAVKYGANTEIAILGAYLHDIGRAKGMLEKHDSPDAAMVARKILAEARYDELTINQVEHLILAHEGRHGGPMSLEEKIVSTADMMSHYRLDFYLTLLRRKYPFGKSDEERKEYYFRKMDKDYSLMPLEEERETVLPARELLREAFELYYHVKDMLDQAKTFWEANQFHSAEQLVFRMLEEINEHYSPSHIAQLHDFIILPFNELSLLYSDSSADIMSAIKVAILEATARVCRELGNLEGAFLAILETSDALHARAMAFWKAGEKRRSRNVFRMVVWARLDAIEILESILSKSEPKEISDLYRRIAEIYESIVTVFNEFVEIEIENSYIRQLRAYEKTLAYYEKSIKFSNDPEAINFVSGKRASINQNLTHAIEKAGGDAVIEETNRKATGVATKVASTPADYKVKADAQELLGDFKGSAISRRLGEDIRRGRNAKTD